MFLFKMIDKQLQHLYKYIEDVYEQDPYDWLINQIKSIEKKYHLERSVFKKIETDFYRALNDLCEEYNKTQLTQEEILYMIYKYLEETLMRNMIYQKALDLGIDPILFKKEMGFLFKGKPLN